VRLGLAGGGTGGHLVPGLQLLEEARSSTGRSLGGRDTGGHLVPGLQLLEEAPCLEDLVWFVTGRAVEERVLAGLEARLAPLPCERVRLALEPRGGGAPGPARLLSRALPTRREARSALVRHRTDVLLGLGGFTSLPCVLAARGLGIPVVLLEVNAVPGRATRWLARFSARVLHAFPHSVPARPGRRHRCIGPPLARAFRGGAPTPDESRAARVRLGFQGEGPLLLVLGGSQGAQALNRFVRVYAGLFAAHGIDLLHQVGPGRLVEGASSAAPGYRAVEYVDDVPLALRAATLVLCRGGASTVAEVGALCRPAWIVPYPYCADDHQAHNARQLAEGGGARIVRQADLDADAARALVRLAGDDGAAERGAMSRALEGRVPTDGVSRLWAELQDLAPLVRT
jgi:UDP-N-acetylglucosamine--N-acetylmuramyl-(pentapeptide) pyrophosphoryl-undecaprenol N-acetylglucosamine transferase